MYGYIYMTTNKVNGKKYIGQHKANTFKGMQYLGSGKILRLAIEKYGADNFEVQMICECASKEELDEKEEYYIQYYNAQTDEMFYNIRRGGDRGPGGPMFKGHKHTEDTKIKMSMNRQGVNNANYGNHWHQSDELKALHSKLSSGENNGMWGKKHSEQTKQLIGAKNSKHMKGRKRIYKDNEHKIVHPSELDNYLKDGWKLGYGIKKK